MTATAALKPRSVREHNVFQTPSQLAEQTVRAIADVGSVPPSVFEPTCGRAACKHAALIQSRSANAKFVIMTQRDITVDTRKIKGYAPATWCYLDSNRHEFESRRSLVYDGRPAFSMFGIGEYTFTDWKVAVSSFHKRIEFVAIPPHGGKPAMVDDTVYYLPCRDRLQTEFLETILNSRIAVDFLSSMILWDEERPITARLLNRLDISRLIRTLGLEAEATNCGLGQEFFGRQCELMRS